MLYFMEDVKVKPKPEQLEKVGLTEVLGEGFVPRPVSTGPSKKQGVVLAHKGQKRIGYYPQEQEWIHHDGYWLMPDHTTPEELARKEQVDGHLVKLGDGNEWLIPIARSFATGCVLPETMLLGPDGQVVKEILPRFIRFSKMAEKVWQQIEDVWEMEEARKNGKAFDKEIEYLDEIETMHIAYEALRLNYRLTPVEINALRLLTTKNISEIMQALLDGPTLSAVFEEQQKAAAGNGVAATKDGDSSNDGTAADLTDTTQPSQTLDGVATNG